MHALNINDILKTFPWKNKFDLTSTLQCFLFPFQDGFSVSNPPSPRFRKLFSNKLYGPSLVQ